MISSFQKSRGAYWLCQLCGWGGVAALGWMMDSIQRLSYPGEPLKLDHSFLPLTCFAGLISTHILRLIIKRGQWLEMKRASLVPRYIVSLVLISLLLSSIGTVFFASPPVGENRIETFTIALMANCSLIGAWMAIYFLLHFYEEFHSAKAERALLKEAYSASQLEALRLQLNPHFLFNALNTIRALIPVSSAEARDAVTKLAETLRVTLHAGHENTISLKREMDVVRDYLSIEKLRFGDDLSIKENIEIQTLEAGIPPLLLLTIVENAIKHGVQHQEERATLFISSQNEGGQLVICVESPGEPISETNPNSLGIGLRNVRERLRLIFGEKTSATLFTNPPAHVVCELRFPLCLINGPMPR